MNDGQIKNHNQHNQHIDLRPDFQDHLIFNHRWPLNSPFDSDSAAGKKAQCKNRRFSKGKNTEFQGVMPQPPYAQYQLRLDEFLTDQMVSLFRGSLGFQAVYVHNKVVPPVVSL
jgi:hypothetical protein